jgi:hypothetical protein
MRMGHGVEASYNVQIVVDQYMVSFHTVRPSHTSEPSEQLAQRRAAPKEKQSSICNLSVLARR